VIVLDASAAIELLIEGSLAGSIRQDLLSRNDTIIVPHLLDIEVLSGLRRLASSRRLDGQRMGYLLSELADLPAMRCPHTPLLQRVWELRHNFTAYDAVYIAMAEATDSVLYTCDQKLCKGHRARVTLFAP
jgi:predicted nucleic acid-binding protein